MQLGMIGLGRMGSNMVARLTNGGHECVVYDERPTAVDAIDEGVPAPVLSAALYQRFSSRGNADFADRVLSAMRHAFGGHVEKPVAPR
jgi:6-phosphogluconate dehydrogenase (decarboxylating)